MSTVILWAGKVLDSDGGHPDLVLGPPDGRSNMLGLMTMGNFQGGFHPDLLPLLNGSRGGDVVTASTLARADVIAFELNGGGPASSGGWESSRWVFSDGGSSVVTVDWDETAGAIRPREVIANGSTDQSNYVSFFGIAWPPEVVSPVISYILFDLPPTFDISSPTLKIRVSGWADGKHGEGTPDPDAIGILACQPQRKLK